MFGESGDQENLREYFIYVQIREKKRTQIYMEITA